jgi:serine/threonine protein kinase
VQFGPYEILTLVGAGGMGEVYRARDTRLNRDVALKVVPEVFTLDPDRLARFKREAQVLASLNHHGSRNALHSHRPAMRKRESRSIFLFSLRCARVSQGYLNHRLIPALCRKDGIPREDARGRTTSHRARSTIARNSSTRVSPCRSNDDGQTRDYAIVVTFYCPGLRVSELCGLNLEDCDLVRGTAPARCFNHATNVGRQLTDASGRAACSASSASSGSKSGCTCGVMACAIRLSAKRLNSGNVPA